MKKDFKNASDIQKATAVDFAQLLSMVAEAVPGMRIRFSTSNIAQGASELFVYGTAVRIEASQSRLPDPFAKQA